MKRYLHFYVWLAAVIMMICSPATISAQEPITSLEQLKMGSVIKIFPNHNWGNGSNALACAGVGMDLTSLEKAGSGESWTLVDAGDGSCYLKNDLGCYWACQDRSSYMSLKCVGDERFATTVELRWDADNNGVSFWNKKKGWALNNLYTKNYQYNWWSLYSEWDATFDVFLVKEGDGETIKPADPVTEKTVEFQSDGIKFVLNLNDKTAQVVKNDYSGDVVIPKTVSYQGNDYSVTSLADDTFQGCDHLTSVSLPEGITELGHHCFEGCSLKSIVLPKSLKTLGKYCFALTSLTTIILPDSITTLPEDCFYCCGELYCVYLPANLIYMCANPFSGCEKLKTIVCPGIIPPRGDENYFTGRNYNVYAPNESIEKYKKVFPWNKSNVASLDLAASISLPSDTSVVKMKSIRLNYSVFPTNALRGGVIWKSDDQNVAIVDANGIVVGKKIGSVKITATAKDNTDISASTMVSVLPIKVESITFSDQKVSVTKTKSSTVAVSVNPSDADNKNVTWTSSDESVATVAQSADTSKPLEAIVTGKKVGKAIIKAEAQDGSGVTATCEVEVTPLPVSDFTTNTNSVVKTIPMKMEMDVTPTDADNKKLKWTSLTPEIAAVAEDGTVTGLKMGTAQLKAETTDGSKISKTFNVEVTGLPVSTISFPTTPISVVKTKTGKIPVTVEPQAADNQKLSWSSSNTDIATVDANGVVTGKKTGSAMITAKTTDGSNVSASVKVTIEPLKVESMTFAAPKVSVVKTNYASVTLTLSSVQVDNKKMVWTSSDESVAAVEQDMTATYPLKAIVLQPRKWERLSLRLRLKTGQV